jgi:hypothetical protein
LPPPASPRSSKARAKPAPTPALHRGEVAIALFATPSPASS